MMQSNIRNRIARHARVRAGDLVPHELNPRTHPHGQRRALTELYAEVGFARSLLAFELPDGRLKLIDGHLRRDIDPEMVVEVEVLDVNEEEARKLLLSIDPLAALAGYDEDRLSDLRRLTSTQSADLANLWASIGAANAEADETLAQTPREPKAPPRPQQQFLILVECPDESTQLALLERFAQEGLTCRAMLS